jgi:hypothetical protein
MACPDADTSSKYAMLAMTPAPGCSIPWEHEINSPTIAVITSKAARFCQPQECQARRTKAKCS